MTKGGIKTLVITGGAGEIGRALTRLYLSEGWTVHVLDRRPPSVNDVLDADALWHEVDLTDSKAVTAVLTDIARIDLLITAVGSWPLLTVDELTPDKWSEQQAINLDSTYFAIYAALPGLRAARGAIVCLSSAIGLKGHAQMIAYAAAKAGILGLVRSLALALGSDSVRVNSVAPGLVLTDQQVALWGPDRSAAFRNTRALDLDITTEDVVAAVHYLGSQEARAVTGQTLVVDGGTVLH